MQRPNFNDIKTYDEFIQYYWYYEELIQICKDLKIEFKGNKKELNHYIAEYFKGNKIEKKSVKKIKAKNVDLTLDTKLIESGFVFNQRFRDFFIEQTKNQNFKFNADMVETAKKVKKDNDLDFSLKDMLDIYYGKLEYAKYDKVSCQWNQFLKDFCADEANNIFNNKLKVASILWKQIRESNLKKVYSKNLTIQYSKLIEDYKIKRTIL